MVVTPHPDDAEFGIAGTVARWTREDKQVIYVVCTNGNKGTNDRSLSPEDLSKIRKKEQLNAADVLGVGDVIFLGYPDQGLEDTSEFRKKVVRLIREYQPTVVVTADPYRRYIWHRDHRITGQVVLDAVFPYARDRRLDITDTFDIKLSALRCHKSQVGHRSVQELEERMRKRYKEFAEGEDFELAEAFHRVEIIH